MCWVWLRECLRACLCVCYFPKGFLSVNDSSVARTSRLKNVLHSFVPKHLLSTDRLRVTSFDGTQWSEFERNTYDRVSHQGQGSE